MLKQWRWPRAIAALVMVLCAGILVLTLSSASWGPPRSWRLDRALPLSMVTCTSGVTGARSAWCELSHVAWVPDMGLVLSAAPVAPTSNDSTAPPVPAVSLLGSMLPRLDVFYRPRVLSSPAFHQLVQQTREPRMVSSLYLWGALAGAHMTHFLINGVFGLVDTMARYPPACGFPTDVPCASSEQAAATALYIDYWGMSPTDERNTQAALRHLEFFVRKPLGLVSLGVLRPDLVEPPAATPDQSPPSPPPPPPPISTPGEASPVMVVVSRAVVGVGNTCPWLECERRPDPAAVRHWRDVLRDTYVPTCRPQRKILLIVREGARRVLDLENVVRVIEQTGWPYEQHTLRDMSHLERAQYFCQFAVVVGMHGNALGNLVFLAPSASLIELMPYMLDAPFPLTPFEAPARVLGLQYQLVSCHERECALPEQLQPEFYALARDLRTTPTVRSELQQALEAALVYQQQHHPPSQSEASSQPAPP